MKTIIWWIRRDLRLHDNPALDHALMHGDLVIPLFILDPHLLSHPHSNRDLFLFNALQSLDKNLRAKGSRLIIRNGKPLELLREVLQKSNAHLITAEADHSPYAKKRDDQIGHTLPLVTLTGLTVHPPQVVRKADGSPYTVYTPYAKVWKSLPLPGKPLGSLKALPAAPDQIKTDALPLSKKFDAFPADEHSARNRIDQFLESSIFSYKERRNFFADNATARISPYLKFGLLSIREIFHRVQSIQDHLENQVSRASCETWRNELIWREFYYSILANFPQVTRYSFRENLRSIRWLDDRKGLQAWQKGLTGYPVVDAAMRQLSEIGWMHNRARMITASFLTKDLLIDWREGESWFMRHLIDGDIASNNGGWQWTAGTGTDAAPYFRIFNPILQSKKFDPDGDYIRQWVPELAHLDNNMIHMPWKFPDLRLDYPPPIIDHKFARERTLSAYQSAKGLFENQSR